MHNVNSFKQVIQGKQPAFLVLAVSLIMKSCVRFQIRDWRCLKPVQATFIASAFASLAPTHPASAGRASKVKIGRFLWNCVIYFFSCVIYFFLNQINHKHFHSRKQSKMHLTELNCFIFVVFQVYRIQKTSEKNTENQ